MKHGPKYNAHCRYCRQMASTSFGISIACMFVITGLWRPFGNNLFGIALCAVLMVGTIQITLWIARRIQIMEHGIFADDAGDTSWSDRHDR
jgi:hypothetical protein